MNESFQASRLVDADADAWYFGEKSGDPAHWGDPDSWRELEKLKSLGPNRKTKGVLDHIRNALCHGSIWTRGNPIDQIVLLSQPDEKKAEFKLLIVAPKTFDVFLNKWLEFVQQLKMPSEVIIT